MARGISSNKVAVAGKTSSLGAGAQSVRSASSHPRGISGRLPVAPGGSGLQGGTKTVIAPKGGRIKGVVNSGIQGGTDTMSGKSKGGSALMGGLKQVRNSQFAPQAGSRGISKARVSSSNRPEA